MIKEIIINEVRSLREMRKVQSKVWLESLGSTRLSLKQNKTAWCKIGFQSGGLRELMGDDFYFLCDVGSSDACQGGIWQGLILKRVHWFGLMLRIIRTRVICEQAKDCQVH